MEHQTQTISQSLTNQVTLFANGLGHFRRIYRVPSNPKGTKISIPINRDHVADVLASLSVFGNVKYLSPPTFTPTNSAATALELDPNNAMIGLIKSLRGAKVQIRKSLGQSGNLEGTLIGYEVQNVCVPNINMATTRVDYVVLCLDGAIHKVPLSDVYSINFLEDSVRTEIDKALKQAFQKIKPESTFLDLALSVLGEGEETAIVQYTVPVAAWKMRYNIRQDHGGTVLEGTAIIDNNSDEEWDNFVVSVVTGMPISFATDLAEIRVPSRARINLIEDGIRPANDEVGGSLESLRSNRGMSLAKAAVAANNTLSNATTANYASFGMVNDHQPTACMHAAASPGVESKDVGDFCVFTSKQPISIPSKRSAIVPMFTVPLTKIGAVLFYKESDHSRRPWRALKFKNETTYSLGRGKVVVYQDGVFSGECILEAAKPGENRMLAHCLEQGVKVVKKKLNQESSTMSLALKDGTVCEEIILRTGAEYKIYNRKDEEFRFILDHQKSLSEATFQYEGIEVAETEKTDTGVRIYFTLAPKQELTLTVTESQILYNRMAVSGTNHWFMHLVKEKHPIFTSGEGMIKAAALHKKVEEVASKIQTKNKQKTEIVAQGDRVRNNLTATKNETSGSEIRNRWMADLDECENEIRQIDKVDIPALENEKKSLQDQLDAHLKSLTTTWVRPVGPSKTV